MSMRPIAKAVGFMVICLGLNAAPPATQPISHDGFFEAIKIGGLTSDELIAYVSTFGVDFKLSAEDKEELLKAGVESKVIKAITSHYKVRVLTGGSSGGSSANKRETVSPQTRTTPAAPVNAAPGTSTTSGPEATSSAPAGTATPQIPPASVDRALPAGAVRIAPSVQAARLKSRPTLSFPYAVRLAQAKLERLHGKVRVDVTVGEDGSVTSVTPVSGHPLLVGFASDSIRQWVYHPLILDGKPVPVVTQVEVSFALAND
jgi:outer membrane biosynthesis protein TonB